VYAIYYIYKWTFVEQEEEEEEQEEEEVPQKKEEEEEEVQAIEKKEELFAAPFKMCFNENTGDLVLKENTPDELITKSINTWKNNGTPPFQFIFDKHSGVSILDATQKTIWEVSPGQSLYALEFENEDLYLKDLHDINKKYMIQ
jgi:hypothetical protein